MRLGGCTSTPPAFTGGKTEDSLSPTTRVRRIAAFTDSRGAVIKRAGVTVVAMLGGGARCAAAVDARAGIRTAVLGDTASLADAIDAERLVLEAVFVAPAAEAGAVEAAAIGLAHAAARSIGGRHGGTRSPRRTRAHLALGFGGTVGVLLTLHACAVYTPAARAWAAILDLGVDAAAIEAAANDTAVVLRLAGDVAQAGLEIAFGAFGGHKMVLARAISGVTASRAHGDAGPPAATLGLGELALGGTTHARQGLVTRRPNPAQVVPLARRAHFERVVLALAVDAAPRGLMALGRAGALGVGPALHVRHTAPKVHAELREKTVCGAETLEVRGELGVGVQALETQVRRVFTRRVDAHVTDRVGRGVRSDNRRREVAAQ